MNFAQYIRTRNMLCMSCHFISIVTSTNECSCCMFICYGKWRNAMNAMNLQFVRSPFARIILNSNSIRANSVNSNHKWNDATFKRNYEGECMQNANFWVNSFEQQFVGGCSVVRNWACSIAAMSKVTEILCYPSYMLRIDTQWIHKAQKLSE